MQTLVALFLVSTGAWGKYFKDFLQKQSLKKSLWQWTTTHGLSLWTEYIYWTLLIKNHLNLISIEVKLKCCSFSHCEPQALSSLSDLVLSTNCGDFSVSQSFTCFSCIHYLLYFGILCISCSSSCICTLLIFDSEFQCGTVIGCHCVIFHRQL